MSDEMEYPLIEHHETVKKDLKRRVQDGELTQSQADEIYKDWLKSRKD